MSSIAGDIPPKNILNPPNAGSSTLFPAVMKFSNEGSHCTSIVFKVKVPVVPVAVPVILTVTSFTEFPFNFTPA